MRQRSGRPLRVLTSVREVTSENWSGETPVEVTHMAGWFDAGPLLPGVDVLLSQAFTEEMAKAADSLRLIQSTGAGIESIDLNVVPEGCQVAVVYEHEEAIGEWIIMAMIALNREALRADRDIREAKWEMHFTRGPTPRPELSGQTLGIVGLGHIGRKTAELATAFGMRVIAATRTVPSDKERLAMGLDFVTNMTGMNIVLQESDFVILSLPLTQGTQGLIGTEELSRMKSSGHLINVSRAGLVDEDALFEALSDGSIKGAALDVWFSEPRDASDAPMPSNRPFWELDNVLMSPHTAVMTKETLERRFAFAALNIDRLARGQPLENVIHTG